MKLEKELVNAIQQANKKTTSAYDTMATVTRVDGDTAWVHVDGGVEETPVEMTIACKKGDKVRVRFSGGYAYTIGNSTAPPTDDGTAIIARNAAFFARTTAVTAKDTADRVDRNTKPAYVSYNTYYKLADIEPLQPTDETWEEEGWSTTQPSWAEGDDRKLWYSIRVAKVSGSIDWSEPAELTTYADIQILHNAIILEVSGFFDTGAIQDSNGEDILDSNNDPIESSIHNVAPIYSAIRQTADEIRSEVSATYVEQGDSGIVSLSSTMLQNVYGVNIYNDISSVGDTYAHIDGDSFDIKVINTAGHIDDAYDTVIASFGSEITLGAWGSTNGTWSFTQDGIKYKTNELTREYNALYGLSKIKLTHDITSPSAQKKVEIDSDGKAVFYGNTITPSGPSIMDQTQIEGGRIDCRVIVCDTIQTSAGVKIGDNYSTSEQRVGRFTDNKPLYQKTINFGSLPYNSSLSIAHSITNVNKIWIYDGFVSGSRTYPLQQSFSSPKWLFYVDPTYLTCETSGDPSDYTASVTVRYTKTTD